MWLNDLPGKNGNFLDVGVSTMPQDSGFIDRSQTRLPESPSFAFGQVLEISVPLRILPSKKNLWIRCFPKLMNINNSDLDRCEATVRLETIRSAISDGGE
jgi:hypothetical protein